MHVCWSMKFSEIKSYVERILFNLNQVFHVREQFKFLRYLYLSRNRYATGTKPMRDVAEVSYILFSQSFTTDRQSVWYSKTYMKLAGFFINANVICPPQERESHRKLTLIWLVNLLLYDDGINVVRSALALYSPSTRFLFRLMTDWKKICRILLTDFLVC